MTPSPRPRPSGRIPRADLARHEAALVEAAGRLFREHGYAGVSIDMIARAARVSPKTVYARHGGKLGLLRAVIEAIVRAPVDVWQALDAERAPAEVLTEAADRFLALVLAPRVIETERLLLAEAVRLPELMAMFYARGPRRGLARLSAYLADQTVRGRLRVAEPDRAAEAFVGLIEGELVRRALFLGQEPDEPERRAWIAYAVGLFLRAEDAS